MQFAQSLKDLDRGAAEAVERDHRDGVTFSDVIDECEKTGPIGSRAGQLVVEDAFDASGHEGVVLLIKRLG